MKPSERRAIESALKKAREVEEALEKILNDNPKPAKLIVSKSFTQWDFQAARYLDATLQQNIKGFKPRLDKELEVWADEFRKLRLLDGRDEETIGEVLKWTVRDVFWRTRVMSGSKFREKYEMLLGQMQNPTDKKNAFME